MDELTPMQELPCRARRPSRPEAREAIWRALEARIEAAAELAELARREPRRRRPRGPRRRPRAARPALAAPPPPRLRRRGRRSPRSSPGPSSSAPARPPSPPPPPKSSTRRAAAASDAPTTLIPGPGQFSSARNSGSSVTGWVSARAVPAGRRPDRDERRDDAPVPDSYNALVPTTVESWTGDRRQRPAAGSRSARLEFWSRGRRKPLEGGRVAAPPALQPRIPAAATRPHSATRRQLNAPSVIDYDHNGFGKSFQLPGHLEAADRTDGAPPGGGSQRDRSSAAST